MQPRSSCSRWSGPRSAPPPATPGSRRGAGSAASSQCSSSRRQFGSIGGEFPQRGPVRIGVMTKQINDFIAKVLQSLEKKSAKLPVASESAVVSVVSESAAVPVESMGLPPVESGAPFGVADPLPAVLPPRSQWLLNRPGPECCRTCRNSRKSRQWRPRRRIRSALSRVARSAWGSGSSPGVSPT